MIPIRWSLILVGSILIQSCSTVKPPVTVTVPDETPRISKTLAEKQERFLKRKVAIARFTNETKYGQGFFYDENNDRLGKQAMDILSSKLASTDKFILLERLDITHLAKEKELGNLRTLDIPADYLILGSITEFGRKTTSDVGVFSRSKRQTAAAKVSIRLVDVRTSQIVYSEEGAGEAFAESGTVLGVGERAEYDATLNDKVLSTAISSLVNNIVENLLDRPWRSYLLSAQDGNLYIAGGAMQGIKEGDIFTVYKRGSVVTNPQTGAQIELPGKAVGKIQVVSLVKGDVNSELSVCTRVSGEMPVTGFEDLYVEER